MSIISSDWMSNLIYNIFSLIMIDFVNESVRCLRLKKEIISFFLLYSCIFRKYDVMR